MPSGPVTSHFRSWSRAKTTSAAMIPSWRLRIHHLVAARAKIAVGLHLGQMPPAAAAFVVVRLHDLPIAFVHCRSDEQLGKECRITAARRPDLRFQARPEDLVAPQRLNRFGDLRTKLAQP